MATATRAKKWKKVQDPTPIEVDLSMFSPSAVIKGMTLNKDGSDLEVEIYDFGKTITVKASNFTIDVEYDRPIVYPTMTTFTGTQPFTYTTAMSNQTLMNAGIISADDSVFED